VCICVEMVCRPPTAAAHRCRPPLPPTAAAHRCRPPLPPTAAAHRCRPPLLASCKSNTLLR
jgi:hypothetical protein